MLTQYKYLVLSVPVQTDKDSNFQVPALLYGFEIWTLNIDLKRQIDVFGNNCLHRIMGYRWNNFALNHRLLRETESRPITSIVRQRQFWLYGNVARYPGADPVCRIVSEKDNPGGGGKGGAHKVRGWGKSMLPAWSYLVWEEGWHGDLE